MCPIQQALSPPYRLDGLAVIRDVIYHCQARVLVVPEKGQVLGKLGAPLGTRCADGYTRLGGGRSRHQYVHRVVWEAAHGPIPAGLEINHVNGRKVDNRVSNLALVTRGENVRHAIELGLAASGSDCSYAKLTEDIVCEIRASERPTREWARKLDVDAKTVRNARRGTSWRHVVCRGAKPVQSRRSRRRTRRGAPEGGAA